MSEITGQQLYTVAGAGVLLYILAANMADATTEWQRVTGETGDPQSISVASATVYQG